MNRSARAIAATFRIKKTPCDHDAQRELPGPKAPGPSDALSSNMVSSTVVHTSNIKQKRTPYPNKFDRACANTQNLGTSPALRRTRHPHRGWRPKPRQSPPRALRDLGPTVQPTSTPTKRHEAVPSSQRRHAVVPRGNAVSSGSSWLPERSMSKPRAVDSFAQDALFASCPRWHGRANDKTLCTGEATLLAPEHILKRRQSLEVVTQRHSKTSPELSHPVNKNRKPTGQRLAGIDNRSCGLADYEIFRQSFEGVFDSARQALLYILWHLCEDGVNLIPRQPPVALGQAPQLLLNIYLSTKSSNTILDF